MTAHTIEFREQSHTNLLYRHAMEFHLWKFTMKFNIPWNFLHDTFHIVVFHLGESRVISRIIQIRLNEGSYEVKYISRATRLECGTSVFLANLGE